MSRRQKDTPRSDRTTQRVQNRDVNAALRVEQAIKLRAARLTYAQIAERAGYGSAAAAYNAIQRELGRRIALSVDVLRREEAAMYDDLQAAVYPVAVGRRGDLADALLGLSHDDDDEPADDDEDEDEDDAPRQRTKRKARGPNLFAVDRVLAISKARRELLGIDARREEAGAMPVERRYIGVPVDGV